MRIVKITVAAPHTAAWTTSARLVEAVRSVTDPGDELVHVYADQLSTGFGLVIFLLVPLDEAAATGCRLVLAAADSLELAGWTLDTVRVWSPAGIS
jgi:hypothetical protein